MSLGNRNRHKEVLRVYPGYFMPMGGVFTWDVWIAMTETRKMSSDVNVTLGLHVESHNMQQYAAPPGNRFSGENTSAGFIDGNSFLGSQLVSKRIGTHRLETASF
ncbi:hypothetical protein EX30DRAFT_349233 [Ascodesmis nigricans]|uniref:Uncharacterized protein n=1 Tax=Ascodesmis nigricans TaxID=341454 RepID=A0A4S2MVX6_9PEZI|nr:hypothetical protein EX30DRAFT_349233 [Ascodesmis nigricans]